MIIQQFLFSRHLNDDEKILYAGHKHFIAVFEDILKLSILGIVFPWVLYAFFYSLFFFWLAVGISIIVYVKMMYILVDWYFDALLITTESLIFVRWHGIFHQESARILYDSIDSVEIEWKGVLSTVLGFGEVQIERENAPTVIIYPQAFPKKLEHAIMNAKQALEERKTGENTEALHGILSELVAQYVKNHGWKRK